MLVRPILVEVLKRDRYRRLRLAGVAERPDVAISLNNLASLYYAQGQYAKAELLYRRALAIHEKAVGAEHPNVATCLENYAFLLRNMGRPEEAAPLEARAKAIRSKHT